MPAKGKAAAPAKPFVLRMPSDMHRMLRTYAASQGKSMNETIIDVLEAWWAKNPDRRAFERLPGGPK